MVHRRSQRDEVMGFTLLEVMVAVAILGLSLTVILSAQVGLFSSGTYGQHVSEATGLARCKMSELEEQFLKLGYPELDSNDEGACCAGDSRQDMRCSWKIERVELPNPTPGGDPLADGGLGAITGLPGMGGPSPVGSAGLNLGGLGLTGGDPGLLGMLGSDGGAPPGVTGTSGIAGMMSSTGGSGGILAMAMSIVYPMLKPMLEASIRRVTVTVMWREGLAKRELEVLQWVTNPTKGGFILGGPLDSASAGLPGSSPTSTSTRTTTPTTTPTAPRISR